MDDVIISGFGLLGWRCYRPQAGGPPG